MSASQELPIAGAEAVERGAGFHVSRSAFPGWAVPGGHLLLLWRCVRQLGMLRSSSYLYDILAWGLVTEAAPLFVALVMIGRNATVISTELALMRVRGEVRFLEQMGIDPQVYLALPRIVALSVSLFAVTFFYQVIAVAGGFGASALLLNVSFADQVQQLLQAVSFTGILFAMIKAFVFGVVIGTIACFAGLYAGDTINDVPRAQIVAYMRSLMWLVAIDLLFLLVAI
jgi:phospholipid/cholesterol/gamma-HCH transport system permease protein